MRLHKELVEFVKMAMLATQRYPWEQGVCMQALYEMGDTNTAIAMAHDAILRQGKDGRFAIMDGSVAVTDPAACGEVAWHAYEETKDAIYKVACEKMLDYLMKKAPRTDAGILCHNTDSFHEGFSAEQIWADSIYMAPPFLAVMGACEEAFRQISGMYDYLADEKTGLVRHIYDAGQNRFVRDKLWATGNGWALMGIARVIEECMKCDNKLLVNKLQELFVKLLDAMLLFQLDDGRFHDILDDENSFVDGASSMMMATAVYRGIVNGWLDEQYCDKADLVYNTMDTYVDEYGIIHGVCGCPHFVSEGTSAESMAAYLMMDAWHDKAVG